MVRWQNSFTAYVGFFVGISVSHEWIDEIIFDSICFTMQFLLGSMLDTMLETFDIPALRSLKSALVLVELLLIIQNATKRCPLVRALYFLTQNFVMRLPT